MSIVNTDIIFEVRMGKQLIFVFLGGGGTPQLGAGRGGTHILGHGREVPR